MISEFDLLVYFLYSTYIWSSQAHSTTNCRISIEEWLLCTAHAYHQSLASLQPIKVCVLSSRRRRRNDRQRTNTQRSLHDDAIFLSVLSTHNGIMLQFTASSQFNNSLRVSAIRRPD